MTRRFDCRGHRPIPDLNPNRDPRTCVQCSGYINPKWTCDDATVKDFYDRLQDGLGIQPDANGNLPPVWAHFRALCEARERHGRERFGFSYLARENHSEAAEEAADFANYALMDSLAAIREYGEDPDFDLVLTAAQKVYEGYAALCALAAKRRGAA